MGGGNGAKSAAARERNLAKKLKDQKQKEHKENRGKVNNDNIKCKICMTTFMVTANVKLLNEHFDSKHNSKGMKIEQCFPHLAPAQS